jgi:CRISPR/Cas system CMR-associated protein Cmr1 (group 7 of RAMP superfamily)
LLKLCCEIYIDSVRDVRVTIDGEKNNPQEKVLKNKMQLHKKNKMQLLHDNFISDSGLLNDGE